MQARMAANFFQSAWKTVQIAGYAGQRSHCPFSKRQIRGMIAGTCELSQFFPCPQLCSKLSNG